VHRWPRLSLGRGGHHAPHSIHPKKKLGDLDIFHRLLECSLHRLGDILESLGRDGLEFLGLLNGTFNLLADEGIIDVGGFLGVGEKEVAVGMDNLKFMTDKNGKRAISTLRSPRSSLKPRPHTTKAPMRKNGTNSV
jgi:hypothetical protein